MVLLGTAALANTNGVCNGSIKSGLKIEAFNNTREKIFFNLCKVCQLETMASIPPSTFSASRIREAQHSLKRSKTSKGKESFKIFNNTYKELSLQQYNSKLMKSIWSFYNRYSPHNVKNISDTYVHNTEFQQSTENSNVKSEPISLSYSAIC